MRKSGRGTCVRERMYWIRLITAVQLAAGVVQIKWRVKRAPRWGLLQVCLLSDAAVKVRCETQAQPSSAVRLVYRQEL